MAPKKNYTPEQMANAINAVSNGETIAQAAEKFGVPRITLHNKVSGKSPKVCSMGPTTYLSQDEEYLLEQWVLMMSKKHVPITKEQLLDSVQKIITDKRQITPFVDNRPGKKWYQLFLKRHPILAERTAQNLTTARDNVTEDEIKKWFKEVDDYLEKKGLKSALEEPERVFNTDESAFFLSPKPGKVLAKRGEKHVYSSSGDDKDNLTVLVTGNAAGQLAPPMVVYSYERIPAAVANKIPGNFGVGRSQSGWMCGSTFFEYITNIFHPWLIEQNIKKPILFFLDGHKSHLTMHLSNFCLENGIEVIALNPNSTHILQPMDLAVFKPLKISWKKAIANWKLQNFGQNLKKEDFAPLIKTALETISKDTIKNGFRAGGLCPFGPSYVDMTKIKSHKIPQAKDLTSQNRFLEKLEKQIKTCLSADKLQLFKLLYYKPRHELNEQLPSEDTSLYVIWASVKHSIDGTIQDGDRPFENTPDAGMIKDAIPEFETMPTDKLQPDNSSSNSAKNESNTAETPSCENQIDKTQTALAQLLQNEPGTSYGESTLSNQNSKNPFVESADENIPDHMTHKTPEKDKSHDTNMLKQPQKDNIFTPAKRKSPFKIGKCIVPSPFKRNFHWPDDDNNMTKGKKRKLREKIPFAVTGDQWREYHEKKEAERKRIQEEKDKRSVERKERKLMKEKLNEEKKRKRLISKKLKTKKPDDTSTDETDTETEVRYCESDDSNYEIDDDLSETNEAEIPIKFRNKKKAVGARRSINSSDSEFERVPLSKLTSSKRNIAKGSYVIVKYEGEYFPGVVEIVDKLSYEISTMTFSTGNTYKWPEKPDKIWYNENAIVEVIDAPVLTNKRGFYTVKEMSKYHIYTV